MNYSQISRLSKASPSNLEVSKKRLKRLPGTTFEKGRGLTISNGADDFHLFVPSGDIGFLHDYSQVDFAWKVVQRLAILHKPFPVYMDGADAWVYKAWAYLRFGPDHLKGEDSSAIRLAWDLAYNSRHAPTAAMIKALLLGTDSDVSGVAASLALERRVVEAYEVLFFNVIGRREDHLFLRNVVYPFSRLEEMLPDYSKNGTLEKMLVRAGYNADRRTALFIGGFRPGGFMDETVNQASSVFQQNLMQTGAVMAATGMLWMDRTHSTISAARSFLQTSKLSGETVDPEDGMASLSDTFRDELSRLGVATSDRIRKHADAMAEAL